MIVLRDVKKVYRMGDIEVHALRGVSLEIADGEFVAIMGPSGSGKSTLMNILGCLDVPSSGSYQLDGIEVAGMTEDELATVRNRKIGFVFQSFNLLPRLSAIEQVELPLTYARIPNRRRLAAAALEAVGLGERMHHKPTELSGGQQQRVAIARALVTRPSMILADEPTGNLDTKASEEIMALFQRLNDQGITVVFVTHEPDIAAFTRRVLHIRDGALTEDERRAPAAPRAAPVPATLGIGDAPTERIAHPSSNGATPAAGEHVMSADTNPDPQPAPRRDVP
jgi:putative ABC transport system ATP-binding protein